MPSVNSIKSGGGQAEMRRATQRAHRVAHDGAVMGVGALDDVVITTPGDGSALVYDSGTATWVDGDHGDIAGLGDDDHGQYYNAARHTKAVHDALGIAALSATTAGDSDTVDSKHATELGSLGAYKTADESVDDSGGTGDDLQNDDHLKFAMAASGKYSFRFVLFVTTATADPDIKVALNGPAGVANLIANVLASIVVNGSFTWKGLITAYETPVAVAYAGAVDSAPLTIEGTVENGATAGDLVLRWAQNTADAADATTVKRGSFVEVRKVG